MGTSPEVGANMKRIENVLRYLVNTTLINTYILNIYMATSSEVGANVKKVVFTLSSAMPIEHNGIKHKFPSNKVQVAQ